MNRFVCFKGARPDLLFHRLICPDLPRGLDRVSILFVSDIHCGRFSTPEALDALIQQINRVMPDLLLFGGDFADTETDERALAPYLAKVTPPPLGAYAVPGNNDYEAFPNDCAPLRDILAASGVTLLVNERAEREVEGGRLILTGVDDIKYGAPDAVSLRFAKRPGDFHILLTHTPSTFDKVIGDGCAKPDLALAGHTHGGQISVGPLSPYGLGYDRRYIGGRKYFFVTGEHDVDGTRVIVTNGVGMSVLPIRIGAPPQIHLILLKRGTPVC